MTEQEFIIDDRYEKLVPRPSKEEYDYLKESLLLNGQREPVIINDKNIILDGHTRYDILMNRGIEVKFTVRPFISEEEEEQYVIDCNLARRHLNSYQKVELVYSMYKLKKAKMQRGGNNIGKKKTGGASAIVGKTIGVNRNIVHMAVWLIENASPKMKERLRKKTITIKKAYDLLKFGDDSKRKNSSNGYPTVKQMLTHYKNDEGRKQMLHELIKEYWRVNGK